MRRLYLQVYVAMLGVLLGILAMIFGLILGEAVLIGIAGTAIGEDDGHCYVNLS